MARKDFCGRENPGEKKGIVRGEAMRHRVSMIDGKHPHSFPM